MTNQAKAKALQSMDIKDKDDWIEVRAEAIYDAIDIALQEQAKEIRERIDKEIDMPFSISLHIHKILEKYGMGDGR
jgi:hypothetical protein